MIQDLARKGLELVLGKAADEAEAYYHIIKSIEIGIEKNEIQCASSKETGGLSFRTVLKGALGFSYTNRILKETVQKAATTSLRIARSRPPISEWISLPETGKITPVEGIYDKKTAKITPVEAVDLCARMIDAAISFDARVRVINGVFSASENIRGVINSHGIELEEKGTYAYAMILTLAESGGRVSSFSPEYCYSRRIDEIDPEALGTEAARKAVEGLEAQSISTCKCTVVLDYEPSSFLISDLIAAASNAENIQRGVSPFRGKIGHQIGVENLTLVDDGTKPHGYNTRGFDGEGVPSKKTILVENGVLKNYLYDNFTAKKDKLESTGNAKRTDYKSLPRISPTNLVMKEGKFATSELISEVKDGVFVGHLYSRPSVESGDFSGVIKQGYKIQDGEISYPLKEIMVSGNVYEVLKNITGMSKERGNVREFTTPMIRIDNMQIVAKS